jgi:hypothetical protein
MNAHPSHSTAEPSVIAMAPPSASASLSEKRTFVSSAVDDSRSSKAPPLYATLSLSSLSRISMDEPCRTYATPPP